MIVKKIILIFLIALSPIVNASIPLVPPPSPGGGIVASMRAQVELQNQYIQNQILREQLAMMQQRRAATNFHESMRSNKYRNNRNGGLIFFTTEMAAQNHCQNDTVVWLNLPTGIWHYKGARWYGRTKRGAFVCQNEAMMAGDRASLNAS